MTKRPLGELKVITRVILIPNGRLKGSWIDHDQPFGKFWSIIETRLCIIPVQTVTCQYGSRQ